MEMRLNGMGSNKPMKGITLSASTALIHWLHTGTITTKKEVIKAHLSVDLSTALSFLVKTQIKSNHEAKCNFSSVKRKSAEEE